MNEEERALAAVVLQMKRSLSFYAAFLPFCSVLFG